MMKKYDGYDKTARGRNVGFFKLSVPALTKEWAAPHDPLSRNGSEYVHARAKM